MSVICGYCQQPARLVPGTEVYGPNARPGNVWACFECSAWVGVNPGDELARPIGTLANAGLRALRKRVHEALNGVQREAYQSLADSMGLLPRQRFKVAMMNDERCLKLLALIGGDVQERFQQ